MLYDISTMMARNSHLSSAQIIWHLSAHTRCAAAEPQTTGGVKESEGGPAGRAMRLSKKRWEKWEGYGMMISILWMHYRVSWDWPSFCDPLEFPLLVVRVGIWHLSLKNTS